MIVGSGNSVNRQQGAALIVGLVLMTVLTLLAVSTMRTATLELAMAGNAQYHEQAVQLAETGIEDALRRLETNALVPLAQNDWNTTFTAPVEIDGVSQGRYEVTIKYLNQCGNPPTGSQGGPVQGHFYEIESTGLSVARNARSTIVRGFWYLTQACPNIVAGTT